MRSRGFRTTVALLAAALAALPAAPVAPQAPTPPASPAAATPVGTATVWGAIETPGAVAVTLVVRNDGPPDRLVAASSPVAARVDLHRTTGHGRNRGMTPLAAGIPIPTGVTVLDAAGAHPMLVDLRHDLAQGDEFPLNLRFADAGDATVTVRVRRRLDAAGLPPPPPGRAGRIEASLASAPPAGLGGAGPAHGPATPQPATPVDAGTAP